MRTRIPTLMVAVLLTVGAVIAAPRTASPAQIPGGVWTFIGNGVTGIFEINAIDAAANVTLTVLGKPAIGFFNTTTNRIVFLRQVGSTLDTVQHYSGDLMVSPSRPVRARSR